MVNIPLELKNLNIIIGKEPYKNPMFICKTTKLKNTACGTFYNNFDTVAFVVSSSKRFKHSFENIINLLYYKRDINIRNKYIKITQNSNWIKFINDLYVEEKIVFINANELDSKYKKAILNSANSILMCGVDAKNKVNRILDSSNQSKAFYAIHPSPINNGDARYTDDWVFIKTKAGFSSDGKKYLHSLKGNFMI